MPSTLALYRRLAGKPMGRWLFSRLVCFKAPYFGSIRPRIAQLEPGCCKATLRDRRAVHAEPLGARNVDRRPRRA